MRMWPRHATTRKICDAAANQPSNGARTPRPKAAPMRASFGKQIGHKIAARMAPKVPSFSSCSFIVAPVRSDVKYEVPVDDWSGLSRKRWGND